MWAAVSLPDLQSQCLGRENSIGLPRTATGIVLVPYLILIDDVQRPSETLGRDIDMPICTQGC